MKLRAYNIRNYTNISEFQKLTSDQKKDIQVVGKVLPFKTNNYVIENLIDWDNLQNDPIFILNFPQRKMLKKRHYEEVVRLMNKKAGKLILGKRIIEIRNELNPHPAGQMEHNIPELEGQKLTGIQHKYRETLLFFPTQGQTCHAYCTFCFRWPQFTRMKEFKFAMFQIRLLIKYLKNNPGITDILITGGDPMVMSANHLSKYINAILEADLPGLKNIRIGTKSLSYWPYRFISDNDSQNILKLFKKVVRSGRHLAIMAHFNHPKELATDTVKKAVENILTTGAVIRTQSPILNHINADSRVWSEMWKKQVAMGMIPYYMFIPRETGAQQYFAVPLIKAWNIFREAYSSVSGISRTVRGPVMSANPGKIQVVGVSEIQGENIITLNFIQGRDPDWVNRPFFAEYNEEALWLNDLSPAFGKKEFFFQNPLLRILNNVPENEELNLMDYKNSYHLCS
jgi:KamA family protein